MVRRNEHVVQIDVKKIPQSAQFCYLRSIIYQDGGIEEDISQDD